MNAEYIVDDRFIIPDDIMRMTSEERQAEIAKLEKEIKSKVKSKEQKPGDVS